MWLFLVLYSFFVYYVQLLQESCVHVQAAVLRARVSGMSYSLKCSWPGRHMVLVSHVIDRTWSHGLTLTEREKLK